jgi:hypothetical protein
MMHGHMNVKFILKSFQAISQIKVELTTNVWETWTLSIDMSSDHIHLTGKH